VHRDTPGEQKECTGAVGLRCCQHPDAAAAAPLPPLLLLSASQFLVSKDFKLVKNVTGGIAAYSMIDRNIQEY
jgi:hypothetical protein